MTKSERQLLFNRMVKLNVMAGELKQMTETCPAEDIKSSILDVSISLKAIVDRIKVVIKS